MSNTFHVYFSFCLLLPEDAAVLADVLGLKVSDVHLSCFPSQRHLVSTPVTELILSLKPLHRHPGLGQFTAEGHAPSFSGLLVLQTRFKGDGDCCSKIKIIWWVLWLLSMLNCY